ncbi:MAG: NAD(P)H-hydrate dehydratase [Paracoccaceae bacterium]
MTELLTAAQMRAVEGAAIESGEVTGLELMERAGRGVVEAIFEEWPELGKTSHRAVVLCGPGNNGGDGFVVARLLKEWGWEVEVYLYGDASRLPVDARTNYERWTEVGNVQDFQTFVERPNFQCDILVDSLFGTGLQRPIEGFEALLRDIVDCVDQNYGMSFPTGLKETPFVVAVDIPSGICSDSGRILVPATASGEPAHSMKCWMIRANLTVTFHSKKLGHHLAFGPNLCGKLVVSDIGISPRFGRSISRSESVTCVDKYFDWLGKKSKNHKFTYGHALILSGGVGKGGAARMAARGALRVGAGVVTVACPPAALLENAGRLDAIMLRPVKDGEALAEILGDTRINALCLGPGMGLKSEKAELLSVVLDAKRATVLDADALTLLAGDDALFGKLHGKCVLTPHSGEFTRLFPDIAEKLDAPAVKGPAYSKVDATREAAALAGCVVLFKGPDTVIAAPDGRCSVNSAQYDQSAPWLATAGSGDVLTGFIAGLLARGFEPMAAAETGAWLHVECARKFGPGLIAEDLPEQLPAVFRDLGL